MVLSAEVSNLRNRAIEEIDSFIDSSNLTGGRLPGKILKRYHNHNPAYTVGWRVQINCPDNDVRELHVLVDDEFPYKAPRVAVFPAPDVLSWPHLEREGVLCILSTDASVSWERPTEVLAYLIREAYQLIKTSCRGENLEDFREEFLSYWDIAVGKQKHGFVGFCSLIEPNGPSRRIVCCHSSDAPVFADDSESIKRWLKRRGVKEEECLFYDAVFLWLPKLLLPSNYPDTAVKMHKLIQGQSPETAHILEDLITSDRKEIDILFGGPTTNGVCFGAVRLIPKKATGGPVNKGNPFENGFRKGRATWKDLLPRHRLEKSIVNRTDHLWLHGRDQDIQQKQLRTTRIAVLGCGSLGGSLARLLAQAGIGNLFLVDGESMKWPNISRHELAAYSINQNKAEQLAEKIKQAYPHLGDISSQDDDFSSTDKNLIDNLKSCNLIISTMGNWAAESFLNNTQKSELDFPPVLYGWVEPNVAAAHAVLITQNGACLRCGVDEAGSPFLKVTMWDEGRDVFQQPACGGLFTPYGSVELCWAHALLAETAIKSLMGNSATHRIWIGNKKRIESAGGTWSQNWIDKVGAPGSGGITLEREWTKSTNCPVCSQQMRAA